MDLRKTIVKIESQKDLDIIYLILSLKNPSIVPKLFRNLHGYPFCYINYYLKYYRGSVLRSYQNLIEEDGYKEITMEDIIKL